METKILGQKVYLEKEKNKTKLTFFKKRKMYGGIFDTKKQAIKAGEEFIKKLQKDGNN